VGPPGVAGADGGAGEAAAAARAAELASGLVPFADVRIVRPEALADDLEWAEAVVTPPLHETPMRHIRRARGPVVLDLAAVGPARAGAVPARAIAVLDAADHATSPGSGSAISGSG